jgi:hypothetical protein
MMRYLYNSVRRGVEGAFGYVVHGHPVTFDYTKKRLIDHAFTHVLPGATSFADLGGVWRVDGAYTFYTLKRYPIRNAYLVDTDFTDAVRMKAKKQHVLTLMQQNFGDPDVVKTLGRVDCIFLFDVLLHQVHPDWDEVLKMYSAATDCFLIYNQQFIKATKTVRLIDLGVDEYFKHVRRDRNSPLYRDFVAKQDEIHPAHNRPWKDIHNVWQWGITDGDLVAAMQALGFEQAHYTNHGMFSNFSSFENHAFIFVRNIRGHLNV